jgi:LysR family transcriptional regulator, glycine cleavage system transcriptional activator
MRRFLPSLSALHAFESAARHRSFTKAGEELGMTQSGVSRQVQNLETFLGVRLFERVGSRLTLNSIGNRYFQDVAQCLNRIEEVSIDAVRGRATDASLMIAASAAIAAHWLTPRMNTFLHAHPDIPVELVTIGNTIDFEQERIDIAILRGFGTWANARSTALFDEQLVVIASPQLVTPDRAYQPLDFARYPTLQNASRPSLWLHWLRSSKLDYSGPIQGPRFPSTALLIQAALSGLGIAVVGRHAVRQELESGELVAPFGPPVRSGEAFWVVQPEKDGQNKNATAFRQWLLREAARERG